MRFQENKNRITPAKTDQTNKNKSHEHKPDQKMKFDEAKTNSDAASLAAAGSNAASNDNNKD